MKKTFVDTALAVLAIVLAFTAGAAVFNPERFASMIEPAFNWVYTQIEGSKPDTRLGDASSFFKIAENQISEAELSFNGSTPVKLTKCDVNSPFDNNTIFLKVIDGNWNIYRNSRPESPDSCWKADGATDDITQVVNGFQLYLTLKTEKPAIVHWNFQ